MAKVGTFLVRLYWWFLVVTMSITLLYKWIPVPATPLMFIRLVHQLQDGDPVRMYYQWTPTRSTNNLSGIAVVCSEDQRFMVHGGLDLEAIEDAIDHNKSHKRKRGASTISQQTAKNIFLWPGRSWVRKGLELYFTGLIEWVWSKERILEVYLNIIEQGNGIYGIGASAKHFFNKAPIDLNRSEAALMAAVLPNPRKYLINKPSTYVSGRKKKVLGQMTQWGYKMPMPLEAE